MAMRGARQYLTEVVMAEAEEADEAVMRLQRTLTRALADGEITTDELIDIRADAEAACREVRDVVVVSERASIAQRIADNVMRGGIAESTRLRARDAGLVVPTFELEPVSVA